MSLSKEDSFHRKIRISADHLALLRIAHLSVKIAIQVCVMFAAYQDTILWCFLALCSFIALRCCSLLLSFLTCRIARSKQNVWRYVSPNLANLSGEPMLAAFASLQCGTFLCLTTMRMKLGINDHPFPFFLILLFYLLFRFYALLVYDLWSRFCPARFNFETGQRFNGPKAYKAEVQQLYPRVAHDRCYICSDHSNEYERAFSALPYFEKYSIPPCWPCLSFIFFLFSGDHSFA